MWIDTHCHLDAPELATERDLLMQRAVERQVLCMVIPAVCRGNFDDVRQFACRFPYCTYALGIHPLYVAEAGEDDLEYMRFLLKKNAEDVRLVAIGEIGLDFYLPELQTEYLREKQEYFFIEQLKMARDAGLPVLLHSRRSVDRVLKYLRRISVPGGIAHAFNGSFQQADIFMSLGFALGFGGAMTYGRARHLRRLAAGLPLEALVVETDAPDMPPAWLGGQPNLPEELPRIGAELANLRGIPVEALAEITTGNAVRVLPRLRYLPLEV
ncbi:MAG: TatD family hydrolase [Alistipes senegalensis]|nr:TatD family hydrolase [Oxalobacter formigenes]MCM1281133.1 TatD family hydrolase [Alistipes senegalensis]